MKLNEIKPNKANPRVIKDDKFKKLVRSLQSFPQMMQKRPIVVDSDMTILGGNMRYKALVEIYGKSGEIPDEWVTTADGWTDEQKREFIIKDNASFGEWAVAELLNDWSREELDEWGVDVPEWNEKKNNPYSQKGNTPIYEIKGEMPSEKDCVSLDEVRKRIDKIDKADISEEQKEMLKVCAFRFANINFANMAEYYAHQNEEMQKLMEESALVIIDFDKAIEMGIVELDKKMKEIYDKEC